MENQNLLHVGSRKLFDTNDIVLLEANENYTKVHLITGQTFISSTTLGKIAARLKDNPLFFRTHRTYIVNLSHITQLKENFVQLDNCRNIFLSRRRKGQLQTILATPKH